MVLLVEYHCLIKEGKRSWLKLNVKSIYLSKSKVRN